MDVRGGVWRVGMGREETKGRHSENRRRVRERGSKEEGGEGRRKMREKISEFIDSNIAAIRREITILYSSC